MPIDPKMLAAAGTVHAPESTSRVVFQEILERLLGPRDTLMGSPGIGRQILEPFARVDERWQERIAQALAAAQQRSHYESQMFGPPTPYGEDYADLVRARNRRRLRALFGR